MITSVKYVSFIAVHNYTGYQILYQNVKTSSFDVARCSSINNIKNYRLRELNKMFD